jgi:subtilisin family serine protease
LFYVLPIIYGDGGGYYCFSSAVDIVDSTFRSNWATGSGGGIYLGGTDQDPYLKPRVDNCLFFDNMAVRDGGGISCNWYVEPVISNCTVTKNRLAGVPSYGGGLYFAYDCNALVTDSIVWANRATNGAQVAVGVHELYEPRPSILRMLYCDVGPSYDPNQSDASPFPASPSTHGASAAAIAGEDILDDTQAALVDAEGIYAQFDAGQEKVKVIVSLKEPMAMRVATDWTSPQSVSTLRAEIADIQSTVLSSLQPWEFELRHNYQNQTGFSGEVTPAGLTKLLTNPMVAHVEPVRVAVPFLAQSIPLANAVEARELYDGSGMAIAIVDTGVDYNHPMLGDGGFPNEKVIGGYDTGDGDPDPAPDGNIPGIAHGTAVAGIAAGDLGEVEDYIGGVAYGAKIYALKASEANSTEFYLDDLLAAWDWCITHRNDDPENPIRVMNNSWGLTGWAFDDPAVADAFAPAFTVAADTAVAAGITVLAASGNDGFAGQGISWPAAMSKVISVGAVYDTTDQVTEYSNTSAILDILAPADPMYTTDIAGPNGYDVGDYFPYFDGTSSACPFAAGAAAILQSASFERFGDYLSPQEVRFILAATGDPVTDAKVDITKPRINLGLAITSLEIGPPVFVDVNCTFNERKPTGPEESYIWDVRDWNPDANNIAEDPNFIAGFYLSQFAAGQTAESNCVDGGSDLAVNLGMDRYTTRTDGVNDVNGVDMGYHYRTGITQYELTVLVVDANGNLVDPNLARGYVDPNSGLFYIDDVVRLIAHPDPNWRVKKWTGTNDDMSTSLRNTVTMFGDTVVTVEFEPIPTYNLTAIVVGGGGTIHPASGTYLDGTVVTLNALPDPNHEVKAWSGTDNDMSRDPINTVTINGADVLVLVSFGLIGENDIIIARDPNTFYPTIQAAIDAAVFEGDVVIVADGIYSGPGNFNLHFNGIPITVRSKNGPENCIIDCQGMGRGFLFQGFENPAAPDPNDRFIPEDPNYIVLGFTITGGYADYGAGLYYDSNSAPLVRDCIISYCTATDGGGGAYFLDTGAAPGEGEGDDPNVAGPLLINCKITDNASYSHGGGIYCTNASPIIIDSEITSNTAGWYGSDEDSFGGGIYCEAGSEPQILNCLIALNSSTGIGGSVYLRESPATIRFCTVAFNYGLDMGDAYPYSNPKGGICCRDSEPIINHCIIGRNGQTYAYWGLWGDEWSSGDDLYNCSATYSCIENGDEGEGNISDDPLWVAGPLGNLYLSQIWYQPQDSPCLNAGVEYAWSDFREVFADYNLPSRTTCILNTGDSGLPDLGYHYPYNPGPPMQYTLVISVVGNGTTDPAPWPLIHYYTPGDWVPLRAIPDPNHRVLSWSGTDNDATFGVYNSVRMYGNRYVTVEFEQTYVRTLNVSASGGGQGTYLGIQPALSAARDGDTIILASGVYPGTGYTILGKNITISSAKPDDPEVVAATVIDCSGEVYGGIHVIGTPGGTCILNGITIRNSRTSIVTPPEPEDPGMRGYDGGDNLPRGYLESYNGAFTGEGEVYSSAGITVIGNHIIANCIVRDCSVEAGDASNGTAGGEEYQPGGDGGDGGDAGGAGIYVCDAFDYDYVYVDDPNDPNYGMFIRVTFSWGSSPQFINCLVENCTATAGNGANGGNGADRASGGDGGVPGRAMGAGIYCDVRTSPTFINCTVRNCRAVGVSGGNGGDGGQFGAGGFGGLTVYDPNQFDPWRHTALGAGVFCDILATPIFLGCRVENNIAEGSVSGLGGYSWAGFQNQPRNNYYVPGFGAGVYCETATFSAFEDCDIQGNIATYRGDLYTGYGGGICIDGTRTTLQSDYYGYGSYHGLYLDPYYGDSDLDLMGTAWATLVDCNFAQNSASVGGGLYAIASDMEVNDCNFISNTSYVGGGLATMESVADILACTVKANIASQAARPLDPNEPNEPNVPDDGVTDPYLPEGVVFGAGGGLYSFCSNAFVKDCFITENTTNGSGAGVYLGGYCRQGTGPELNNCLITDNIAGKDGGGVSCNWYADVTIANCTIADNQVGGDGKGGGLYCSYDTDAFVTDSIIWGNWGGSDTLGYQIALGSESLDGELTSTLTILYSDVGPQVEPPDPNMAEPGEVDPNAPDYVTFSQFDTSADHNHPGSYGVDGWIDADGTHRIIHYSAGPNYPNEMDAYAYIHTVTIEGDDWHAHPNNPYSVGDIAPRTFTLERTFDLGVSMDTIDHGDEFYVDVQNNVIYLGAHGAGIRKYVWDPGAYGEDGEGNYVYDSTIAPATPSEAAWTQSLAYDPEQDVWYAGSIAWEETDRQVWKYEGAQGPNGVWEVAFTYEGGSHHDGMELVNGYLYLADFQGDYVFKITPEGTLVDTFYHEPLNHELEGMGFGALEHFWVGSHGWSEIGNVITEFGGGELQLALAAKRFGPPIYAEQGCEVRGWDPNDPNNPWDPNTGNIMEDPNFVAGYYLSHIATGQQADSPCIDAGSGDANDPNIVMDLYTTRIDGVFDTGIVDMGYHYNEDLTQYILTVSVVDSNGLAVDPDLAHGFVDPNGTLIVYDGYGYIDPNGMFMAYNGYRENVIELTAYPDEGYRVSRWTGTDNDSSTSTDNTVTVSQDTIVTVELEPIPVHQLTTVVIDGHGWLQPATGPRLEGVIDLIAYPDPGYRVKAWTGTNDDASTQATNAVTLVADTVVTVEFELPRTIRVSGDPNAIQDAIDLARPGDALIVLTGTYIGPINTRGKNITVTSTNPDDPNIVAATVVDCNQTGRGLIFNSGEDANTLVSGLTIIGGNILGQGAGIFVGSGCSPTIRNVVVADCNAFADPNAIAGQSNGGGIYVSSNARPEFINVTVRNCSAVSGGGAFCESDSAAVFKACIFSQNTATSGGGMFCEIGSLITVVDCNFADNVAIRGAGLYAAAAASGRVVDTLFIGNDASEDGGAVYLIEADDILIAGCDILSNYALRGAGLYCEYASGLTVTDCAIRFNQAPYDAVDMNDPNDPNAGLVGQGGGIWCLNTSIFVSDSVISHNIANASGGAVYMLGEVGVPRFLNCLIANNLAGRDGGGVSANWFVEPILANCTFAGNAAIGTFGHNDRTGVGGGFYCGYDSNCAIVDSIFWDNYALLGHEIAVGTGFEFELRPSTLAVSYTDIKGGLAEIYVEQDCNVLGWLPGEPGYGTNINADPLFVIGPLGDYYLSQIDAKQSKDSPCVDAGSDDVVAIGFTEHTTRTDEMFDAGIVDMGYHYPLSRMFEPCKLCDFIFDGIIDMNDLAVFALKWLDYSCSDTDDWCEGVDLTFDGKVNFDDYAFLADCWGVQDVNAPEPNPAEWEIEPYWLSETAPYRISMTAKSAYDAWGWDVEYEFVCVTDANYNSGWRSDRTYEISGISFLSEYCFMVRAADALGNATDWSVIRCAKRVIEDDTTPPTPAPYIQSIDANSATTIVMTSSTSFDPSAVEYYFEAVTPGANDSNWQDATTYVDANLLPETTYCYRVKARDKSPNRNETTWSEIRCVTTPPPLDTEPPTPDPMEWDRSLDANSVSGIPHEVLRAPYTVFDYWAVMRADPNTTDDSGQWEFFFDCTTRSNGGYDSGWIAFPGGAPYEYSVKVGVSKQEHIFRVRARDPYGNMTAWSEPQWTRW